MPDLPPITGFLYTTDRPVTDNDPILNRSLPMGREPVHYEGADFPAYRDYFETARRFMKTSGAKAISEHLARSLNRPLDPSDIDEIRIVLEKHGQYYHPAKVCALFEDRTVTFALNAAFSGDGKKLIATEYENLVYLNRKFGHDFLPRVYAFEKIMQKSDEPVPVFLADWHDDYHEFHLSEKNGRRKMIVWDGEKGHYYLSDEDRTSVYAHSARILTTCYDPVRFFHIASWHHAAGDFVVKKTDAGVNVKLVTVRRYHPLIVSAEPSVENILHSLLIFFLHTTIRMRLDRLDGTGNMVWADDIALFGAVKGVFDGLFEKEEIDLLPAPLFDCFLAHLFNCSFSDLMDIAQTLTPPDTRNPEEYVLTTRRLEDHITSLMDLIQAIS